MSRINPTLRGFLIIALIAAVIVALRLEASLSLIAWVAAMVGTVIVLFLVWRERRSEISTWPGRAQAVLYGAAFLAFADVAAIVFMNESGLDAVAFVGVLAASGFALWRTWKDQHTYV